MSLLVCISILVTFISTFCAYAADISPSPAVDESAVLVKSSISASGIVIIVLILLLIISVAVNAWFVKIFFKHKETFDNLHSKMCSLRNQNKSLKAKYASAKKNVSLLDNWKEYAVSVDSSIEDKVTELQSKHLAEEFDTKYGDLVNFTVSTKGYTIFKTACEAFENLPQVSKYYVQTDIDTLKQKCEASRELKIKDVSNNLEIAISSFKPTKRNRENWDKTVSYIKKVPKEIKDDIDERLISAVYKNQQLAYGKKWHTPLRRPFCGGVFPFT